jgi:SAM-dependent methyltransferase
MECPLCHARHYTVIHAMQNRTLYACHTCKLVYAAPDDLLECSDEKERYLDHENSIEHPGYVKFLMQAITEGIPYLTKGQYGLDFGCGPGPTLSVLMDREGFDCDDYDPLFFPELPSGPYDYIFATECFEHFYQPEKELLTLLQLLNPGGILTIMTEQYTPATDFSTWYYVTDPTHVCFFHADTFSYICAHFGFEQLKSHNPRVVVLRKV